MIKNEERIGVITALGNNGEGIIKDEGIVTFVPFSLVGEKVKYKILKVTSKFAYGKLLEVLTPAESRIRPKCPYFTKCGGCQLQHIKYSEQLKVKENTIKDCFKKIAGLKIDLSDSVRGDNEWGYRNKLQLPVSFNGESTVIGFYAENSHRVIPIDDCLINGNWTKDVICAVKTFINQYNIKGYNEFDGCGELREITVKEINDKLIITAVTPCDSLRNCTELIQILKDKLYNEFSLYVNVNKKQTNVIYGEQFNLVYGKPSYNSEMLGIKYTIGVQSFMQVNSCVCKKLYSAVKNAINSDSNTTVIDAYSGAGLMTAIVSENAKKVIGIEIVPEAVECADQLALINGLSEKISNYQGKCEDILPDIIEKEKKNTDKISIILDPPRKGCDRAVIEAVKNSGADTIVYVSCMPSTLARDIGLLVGTLEYVNGEIKKIENPIFRYEVQSVRAFDMFAQTKHVETLCVLKRV